MAYMAKSLANAWSRINIAFAALLLQYYMQTLTLTPTLTLAINEVFFFLD